MVRTRSKAVEQALGWVATKMGFCDMVEMCRLCVGGSLFQVSFFARFSE